MDAIYLSYTHTYSEFLTDKDRLKTYRVGAQYRLNNAPNVSFQFEVGAVDYEGIQRKIFNPNELSYRNATGFSSALAWVVTINDNVGFRLGVDGNYIDNKKTFLPYSFSATYSTGIVLRF